MLNTSFKDLYKSYLTDKVATSQNKEFYEEELRKIYVGEYKNLNVSSMIECCVVKDYSPTIMFEDKNDYFNIIGPKIVSTKTKIESYNHRNLMSPVEILNKVVAELKKLNLSINPDLVLGEVYVDKFLNGKGNYVYALGANKFKIEIDLGQLSEELRDELNSEKEEFETKLIILVNYDNASDTIKLFYGKTARACLNGMIGGYEGAIHSVSIGGVTKNFVNNPLNNTSTVVYGDLSIAIHHTIDKMTYKVRKMTEFINLLKSVRFDTIDETRLVIYKLINVFLNDKELAETNIPRKMKDWAQDLLEKKPMLFGEQRYTESGRPMRDYSIYNYANRNLWNIYSAFTDFVAEKYDTSFGDFAKANDITKAFDMAILKYIDFLNGREEEGLLLETTVIESDENEDLEGCFDDYGADGDINYYDDISKLDINEED
jgi:hypothetical protein